MSLQKNLEIQLAAIFLLVVSLFVTVELIVNTILQPQQFSVSIPNLSLENLSDQIDQLGEPKELGFGLSYRLIINEEGEYGIAYVVGNKEYRLLFGFMEYHFSLREIDQSPADRP